jgi:hypothetical protein
LRLAALIVAVGRAACCGSLRWGSAANGNVRPRMHCFSSLHCCVVVEFPPVLIQFARTHCRIVQEIIQAIIQVVNGSKKGLVIDNWGIGFF